MSVDHETGLVVIIRAFTIGRPSSVIVTKIKFRFDKE